MSMRSQAVSTLRHALARNAQGSRDGPLDVLLDVFCHFPAGGLGGNACNHEHSQMQICCESTPDGVSSLFCG